MALTREFKETFVERIESEPEFASAILKEAITVYLNGEADIARMVLRDLVNATIGFETLSSVANIPSKSLHRMLSDRGNPSMTNFSTIVAALSDHLKVSIETKVVRKRRKKASA